MAMITWQCTKCGKQTKMSSPPSTGSCPNGGKHIWSKLGRFIKTLLDI